MSPATPVVPIERNHIPRSHQFLTILRIIQLLLAIVLLGLAAYGISVFSTSGEGLTIFTAIVTILVAAYVIATEHKFTVGYNYWAIIALDAFLIIFWLISFAKDAAEASAYRNRISRNPYIFNGINKRWRNALIASAVLSAFQFILFILSFLATRYYVSKHRDAGGHSIPYVPQQHHEIDMRMQPNGATATEYNRPPPVPPTAPTAAATTVN